MAEPKILEAIKKVRETAKKRNFTQSFDLIINLKNINLKKAENKIKTETVLPKGTGREVKIGIFADSLVPAAQKIGKDIVLIKKNELEAIGKDKKRAKKIAKECHAFIAEAPLMPLVGRFWGPILAVRNKMPKPIPPTLPNLEPLVERNRNIARIILKDSPVVQHGIGREDMKDEDIAANASAILKALEASLPLGKDQIKEVCIKLSMSKPVRVEMK